MARPTKYQPLFANVARQMSMIGARPADIARALDCTSSTLHDWARAHPEFKAGLNAGRAETGKVIVALARAARGYTRRGVKPMIVSLGGGVTKIVDWPVTEYHPPNVTACLAWLKRHVPDVWGDAGVGTAKAPTAEPVAVAVPVSVLRLLADAATIKQGSQPHDVS